MLLISQICDISIREYKANVKPGSRKDSLSTLIAAREDDGTGLSHDELVGMANVFLVAGQFPLSIIKPKQSSKNRCRYNCNYIGIRFLPIGKASRMVR